VKLRILRMGDRETETEPRPVAHNQIGPFKPTFNVKITNADGTSEVREVRRIKILDGQAVIRAQ